LAHKSNRINLSLADSSRRIAMDAQKDSSIMKSIALLTMVFLPATFLAVSLVPIKSLSLLILFTLILAAKDGFYGQL
jgi:hypothetical protein